ncbi:MAG TPA: SLBB domain-containing protein [Terracidiphilus sp.]|jgi:protein involved in polysaccharide export with SLBB domain
MRIKLCVLLAAPLFAVLAHAQDYPYPGSGQNPSSETTPSSNLPTSPQTCADPLMAGSPLCSGGSSSNSYSPNLGPFSGSSSSVSSAQQGRITTYTDERGLPLNNRNRPATIPLPSEPLTEFQKFTASTTGMVLPVYGANLFQNVPSTFAPLDNSPVPPDYVIGPDDEVRVRVWGQVNFNANVHVDRSGVIYLPNVGAVQVAGASFAQLDQRVRAAVGKIYRNFDLTVQLGQIRAIQVYVTGEARRPGVYTVSSLSTLVDALFASGGPSVQGSMRQIVVKRAGVPDATFDLYHLLIGGDKSKDTKMLPGDLIYIPPVGPQVAVFGSVRRAAIYELLPGDTIGDAIKDAGSLTSLASEARASLERSAEHSSRQAMEVRLDAAGMSTPMSDGDILRVISMVSKFQKTITLRGNTANPGRFAWHEGMRLSDLIPDRESLITRDYWWKRVSLGLQSPEFQPLPALSVMRQPTNPVDLPQQQSMAHRTPLPRTGQENNQPGSTGSTTNAQDQNQSQTSDQYQPYNTPDQPFFWDNSDTAPLPVNPNNVPGNNTTPANGQASDQQSSQDPNSPRTVGRRSSQSALADQENETPNQINPRASRRTVVRLSVPEIDWSYAVIERMDPKTLKTDLIPFDLGKLVLQHDASQDLELQPGDMVSVFSQSDIHVPIAEQTGLVRLEGEFAHAGTYSVHPNETLRSLVERAGGLTPNAYLYGSVFTRESTRILQQRRMDETVQSMALQLQRGNLALAASPVSTPQDLAGITAAQTSGRELIAQLQLIRANGRIVFAFKPDSKDLNTIPDIPLENGDSFLVPSVPSTVNAVGAIFNQNSFIYRPEARLSSYLDLAGGPNTDADHKRMFVVRANGAVVSRESVKSAWGNEFLKLKLNPGDTIIVPDKTIKPSALRGFLDWSQIVSQMTFGIAAATVLF